METPNQEQAPATEAPATEAPATEAPATEAPATEAPATEAPKDDIEVVKVISAPRNQGQVTIKKALSFEEIEKKRVLESVKTFSTKVLENQLKSKVISEEFRGAVEAELELRKK